MAVNVKKCLEEQQERDAQIHREQNKHNREESEWTLLQSIHTNRITLIQNIRTEDFIRTSSAESYLQVSRVTLDSCTLPQFVSVLFADGL